MFDICCIGHITSDKVITPATTKYMAGGTAYYFSVAISKLDVNYLLVTAIANKEIKYVEALREKGVNVDVQPSTNTVYFENIYGDNPDDRTQNVLQKADAFTIDSLLNVEAKIYHLGPLLADDISTDLIKALSRKGKVSLDVQGYLRKVENHKVFACGWSDKKEALQCVSIVKADEAELRALTGYDRVEDGIYQLADWGVKEIVITNGSKGSWIFYEGVFYQIPAYPPKEAVDATGCGDTYMTGYLYKRAKLISIPLSGRFAAAMASLKMESSGPFIGTEQDVIKRIAT